MKTFNFDTTFTKGKKTYSIVNNEVSLVGSDWLEIGAAHANALIEHLLENVIIPQVAKAKPSSDFDTLVKEVRYLEEALKRVNWLKEINCSYGNKGRELLEAIVRNVGSQYYDKIPETLTVPQQLVITRLNRRCHGISSWDLQGLYNPVTDDTSKLEKWLEELVSFDYDKHGVSKDNVISKALDIHQEVSHKIDHFRIILSEAGDDIINWSDQKISLRFTKLDYSCKAWEISSYVSKYVEHLKSKGILKVDKKKNTSKGKLEDIIKSGKATQDEKFRYYKQMSPSDDTLSVLEALDLEHLFKIIDSDLKCVKNKLLDKWGRPDKDHSSVCKFLCEKSVTKQDYLRVIEYASPSRVSQAFMVKHKDHATTEDVMNYCSKSRLSQTEHINEEFYQTCLDVIPNEVRYTLDNGLTWQYMVRMNESERVEMLKRIAGSEVISIDHGTLYGLYHMVDYSLIKDIILKDKTIRLFLSLKLVKENDIDSMIDCAISCGDQLGNSQKRAIFSKLTFGEKKRVILFDTKENSSNNYSDFIKDIDSDDLLDLLKHCLKEAKATTYTFEIFKSLEGNRQAILDANNLVKDMESVDNLPLYTSIINKLTVATKIELLNKELDLKDSQSYRGYGYAHRYGVTSIALGKAFFSDFKREDIDKVYDSPMVNPHTKFLAHTMSQKELESCAKSEISRWSDRTGHDVLQASFFRYNLDLFSYSFLKQFQDKTSFKLVVGDRRDTSNKSFGEKLLAKMNVTNSIDFMFS